MSHGGVWILQRQQKKLSKSTNGQKQTDNLTLLKDYLRPLEAGLWKKSFFSHSPPLDFFYFFAANSPFPSINMTHLIPSGVHLNKSECGYLEHTAPAAWSSVVWFSSAMDYYTFGNLIWNTGNQVKFLKVLRRKMLTSSNQKLEMCNWMKLAELTVDLGSKDSFQTQQMPAS